MFSKIKSKIPKPLKKVLRTLRNTVIRSFVSLQRKTKKVVTKTLGKEIKPGYHFAILCIKKTIYADMVIENINSLHYINAGHMMTLYCDTLCFDYLNKRNKLFNYPEKVIIKDSYGIATKAWQHYKIDVHIQAAWNDQIDTDADGVWHTDPVVDKNKVTTLVFAYSIKDKANEVNFIKKIFNKPEWTNFNHYVAAFVSIPKKFMTEKIAQDLRYFNDTIFYNSLDFIENKDEREDMRRLSEEFAINLTLQTNFKPELITTLKTEDGPGSKNSLQSLYYGCLNRVTE